MREAEPTTDEWRNLYRNAALFKDLACWKWMDDEDLFGVKDPEGDEMGYCVVLGAYEESFGLVVYLGTRGLLGYFQILDGEITTLEPQTIHTQRCLWASFEDRIALQKEDRKLIKDLGLTFRGRKEWPFFRQYTPGYHPWFLYGKEARFLTHALEQASNVALRYKEDPNLLFGEDEESILVRAPHRKGHQLYWEDEWITPRVDLEIETEDPPLNELKLHRIKNRVKRSDTFWVADVFYSPSPVQEEEGDRPYYPPVFLLIDGSSGFILNCELFPNNVYIEGARESLLSSIEKTEVIPHLLLLGREEITSIFDPIAKKLGIAVQVEEDLDILDEVKQSLFNMFS